MANVRGGGEQEKEPMNDSNIDLYEEEAPFQHKKSPHACIEMPDLPQMDDASKNLPKVGLIFMDNFSPYHGQYLSYMARKAYNVGIVNVLSGYMIQYLTKKQEEKSQ